MYEKETGHFNCSHIVLLFVGDLPHITSVTLLQSVQTVEADNLLTCAINVRVGWRTDSKSG